MAMLLARNAVRTAPKRNSLITAQRRFLNNGTLRLSPLSCPPIRALPAAEAPAHCRVCAA